MSTRLDAFTKIRERWKAALPTGVRAVYANWKPAEGTVEAKPDPGATVWVREVLAPGFGIDDGISGAARIRTVRASVQLEIHAPRDGGVKPALSVADALELALLTGAPSYLADGVTPILVYDTAVQPVRDDGEWFMIPLVVFYSYTVALAAA